MLSPVRVGRLRISRTFEMVQKCWKLRYKWNVICMRRLLIISITCTVCNLSAFLLYSTIGINESEYECRVKVDPALITINSKPEQVRDDSVVIIRSVVLHRSNGLNLKILVLQKCGSLNGTVYIKMDDSKILCPAVININGKKCPWEWAKGCAWNAFMYDLPLPAMPNTIEMVRGRNSITLRYEELRKTNHSRLAVCIQPLYWYVDWLQIVEFVEMWKSQGADRFFFYYHTINEDTMRILRYYQSKGLVTLIPWKSFPASNETDPNKSVYRLGHTLAMNDCLFRALIARFVAFVDVDEFIFTKKGNLYGFLNDCDRVCSRCAGYTFPPSRLYYQNQRPVGKFLWSEVKMEWLKDAFALKPKDRGPKKVIYRPERVNIVSVHNAMKIYPNYVVTSMRKLQVLMFHARNTWIHNETHKSEAFVLNAIPSNIRKQILVGYRNAMNEIMAFNESVEVEINLRVKKAVDGCNSRWRLLGCKLPNMCGEWVRRLDNWIYADNDNSTNDVLKFQVV